MPNTNRTKVSTILWTAQVLLALLFLFAGTMKFVLPIAVMAGPLGFSGAFLHFIGTAEILGALGLVLPGALRIRTGLTPLAASGLVIIMIGATVLTTMVMGLVSALLPFLVGVIAAAVCYGRWRVAPLTEARGSRALQAVESLGTP
ncbi:MAG: DoxX family protein [Gemmatimonadaceae bacterium]